MTRPFDVLRLSAYTNFTITVLQLYNTIQMNKYADEFNFDADALHYGPGSATNGGGD
jgi:hypothetical protein